MCRFTADKVGLLFVMEPIHISTVVLTARYYITVNSSVYKNDREVAVSDVGQCLVARAWQPTL